MRTFTLTKAVKLSVASGRYRSRFCSGAARLKLSVGSVTNVPVFTLAEAVWFVSMN